MKITEIQIIPIKPRDGLVAFASIVVENSLYLGFLGVYTRLNGEGYRITYPTKKIGEKSINIYHPINKETSQAIERVIIEKAKKVFEKSNENSKKGNE
ncbi:MAG: septation protein SpoVG family protein [bacterium]|nr:septation protein SpoVG family protein [bacterium]